MPPPAGIRPRRGRPPRVPRMSSSRGRPCRVPKTPREALRLGSRTPTSAERASERVAPKRTTSTARRSTAVGVVLVPLHHDVSSCSNQGARPLSCPTDSRGSSGSRAGVSMPRGSIARSGSRGSPRFDRGRSHNRPPRAFMTDRASRPIGRDRRALDAALRRSSRAAARDGCDKAAARSRKSRDRCRNGYGFAALPQLARPITLTTSAAAANHVHHPSRYHPLRSERAKVGQKFASAHSTRG